MKLRTEIELTKQESVLNYDSQIVLFGSCFAENIGDKLDFYKFPHLVNPFGILFHPIAIENALDDICQKKIYTENDLYFHNDLWQSFKHHSKFSSESKSEILSNINTSIENANQFLKNTSHIIITLGTAWVYEFTEQQQLVANCHKISQKKFQKRLLFLDEIEQSLKNTLQIIHSFNPTAQVIFTVSPVRHLSNGIAENSQSKALLLTAIHQAINQKNTHYFPSFEIMMDDLRDYRFYKSDLIHPNDLAVAYIWEQFKKSWIDEKSYPLMDEISDIQKALQHRPFNENSPKHQVFLKDLQLKIDELAKKRQIHF
ncbi:MAG: GSCFA domain-containing protein [Flavobacteriaceae bacterium]|nr:GSCFA domain-containing protein [Flavobacteriaceae bacterium]